MNAFANRIGLRSPVVTELHASVCALVGSLVLAGEAVTLARAGGVFAVPLGVGAGLGLVSAVLPWVWPEMPLTGRRAVIWAAWLIASLASILAFLVVDYSALLGAQLLLLAAVLPEMSDRPESLRWFWVSLVLIAAIVLIYRGVVDLRPIAD